MSTIALIPARKGSKRIPDKNIKDFFGHPLMAYTIQVAKDSGLFGEHIYVSSDSDEYLEIAERYGAKGISRDPEISDESAPDILWIDEALNYVDCPRDYFVLRPTSPFRTFDMLIDALGVYSKGYYNLKAVEPIKQHPHKAWRINDAGTEAVTWSAGAHHTWPTNTLPLAYIQNASLEIRSINLSDDEETIVPYITKGYEGFDLNTPEDWILAEALVEKGLVKLPEVTK